MHCWHGLNKGAASGVDGLTAETYATNLEGNIADLAERVKAGRYRAKFVRRVYIPKENGKERPLGIPALEDKLVQLACAKLLGAIYEEDFRIAAGTDRGETPRIRCADLTFELMYGADSTQTGHPFQRKLDTRSTPTWTVGAKRRAGWMLFTLGWVPPSILVGVFAGIPRRG